MTAKPDVTLVIVQPRPRKSMPRQVDHDARRQEVSLIAAKLIAQVGVERVTVRELARAAGYSTAIVSHYFADKRQLLLFTYQAAAQSAQERVDAVLGRSPDDLEGCLTALLPLDEERRREWQVWFAFWGMAIGDAEFAAEQRRRMAGSRRMLVRVLRAMSASGKLPPNGDFDPDLAARQFLTLINGLAVQVGFDPDDWPAERQMLMLKRTIAQTLSTP
ncbi:MAG: TetR family transcriptional regulator [Alphaproteobacteria bacterium]|nr:TetR family transcriptional regulator [Alphaproteobacteria bacterium]